MITVRFAGNADLKTKMETGVLLFNGIHYPVKVVDQAMEWAKQNGKELTAIFLQESEEKEGYGFPSDLDKAQELNTTEDINRSDDNLVENNIKMIAHAAKISNIAVTTKLLKNPAEEQLIEAIRQGTVIFVSEKIDDYAVAAVTSFNIMELLRSLNIPLHSVKE
ncbi:MAG: hypothetical protein H7Y27_05260 [Gemmatimonadaceae bacterium]|nr:hypothetical protein [Chitinophagaceae bacterium]